MPDINRKIKSTPETPEISISEEGIITIRGRWMMENIARFSESLSDWYDHHISEYTNLTTVNIHLEYFSGFNTGVLMSFLRKLIFIKIVNKGLVINWIYEEGDEDILEFGKYLSSALRTRFNYIQLPDSVLKTHSKNIRLLEAKG